MKLRDHPLMTRKSGSKTWPPLWTTTHQDKEDKPIGEVGNLEDVMMSYLTTNKVFMFMRYKDLRYMGFMIFDDPAFCYEIYRLLKSNLGRSIKEIGDMDLSYTL
jgi:hypothetical protein